MKKEVEVFEKILDKHAKQHMIKWSLSRFRNDFPRLRRVFLDSMMEIYLKPPKIEYTQQNNIEILRPCLWFAKGQVITYSKMKEYYTHKSILSLLEYKYIKIVPFESTQNNL